MIDINKNRVDDLVNEYLKQNPIKQKYPEGVKFGNYNIMASTGAGWVDMPTKTELENLIPIIELRNAKEQTIIELSNQAIETRQRLISDSQQMNAALGIYTDAEKNEIAKLGKNFRSEYYRLKGLIKAASTLEEIQTIKNGSKYGTFEPNIDILPAPPNE